MKYSNCSRIKCPSPLRCLFSLLIFIGFALLSDHVQADEYGVVMDVKGNAVIVHDGKKIRADLGQNIFSGDSIVIDNNALLVFVSYESCEEWRFNGPERISIHHNKGPVSKKHKFKPSRILPVCYSPEEFREEPSSIIGGFVLRGRPADPVAELRQEFLKGDASNTVLMTLIMHDLSHGNVKRAIPYYNELKKRIPRSSFVKGISPRFSHHNP